MIPEAAVEAAHKAWREQAALDGSIFEYNLRAALEAAAPHIKKQALDDAALETLRRGDVGKDGGIKVDVFLMWRARQEAGTAPWGVGK